MQTDWAYQEFTGSIFGDSRCRRSIVYACETLVEKASLSFSMALGNRRKAVSRILHHKDTTSEGLLRGQGFLLHSALALIPEGLPLGILHQKTWVRDEALVEVPKEKRDPEDKESKKWLEALRGVEKALPASQKALLIQDREADIFSFFAAKRNANIDLLIRAAQPRNVFLPGAKTRCSLWKVAEQAPVLGALSFTRHPQSKVVAWRLLYLTYLARELPETPAEEVLSGRERELLEQKTGHTLLTVRDAILAVASLVHFKTTPSAPNPGVKTLWIGFRKLADMLEGYKIARNIST